MCRSTPRRPRAFAGGPTPGDFLDEISAPGTLDAYWQINKDAVNDILFANLTAPARATIRSRASR